MKKYNSLLIICLMLIGYTVRAQKSNNEYFGAYLIMPIECPFIDDANTNKVLATLGYPDLDLPNAVFGLGMQDHFSRLIFRFDFDWSTVDSESTVYLTSQSYNSFNMNFGWDLMSNKYMSFYPYLGYKYSRFKYSLRQKHASGNEFQDYFSESLDSKSIEMKNNKLDLGLGLALHGTFLLDVRFGYLVSFSNPNWTISGTEFELKNNPSVDYPYYLTITFGLGAFDKSKNKDLLNKQPVLVQAY